MPREMDLEIGEFGDDGTEPEAVEVVALPDLDIGEFGEADDPESGARFAEREDARAAGIRVIVGLMMASKRS